MTAPANRRTLRALFRRAADLYAKHAVAIDLALIVAGANAVKRRLDAVHDRLEALEERGLVPLDDLVTIRDAAKIDRRVWELEGRPGPDPLAALEEPAAGEELEAEPAADEELEEHQAPAEDLAERPGEE